MSSIARSNPPTPSATPAVSIVVPVLDERDALPGLIDEIDAVTATAGLECELIFVDDGSSDGTGEYLNERGRSATTWS